jgi:RNA polymerase primary sigma factor
LIQPLHSPFSSTRKSKVLAPGLNTADLSQVEKILQDKKSFFYVKSRSFWRKDSEKKILNEGPDTDMRHAADSWSEILNLDQARNYRPGKGMFFSTAEEKLAFWRFNYTRYRVNRYHPSTRRKRGERVDLTLAQKRRMLEWYNLSEFLRHQIAIANLGLATAMLKRVRVPTDIEREDLMSEAIMAIDRAVNKFDVERGFKFSTYACRAILKSISRALAKQAKHRGRFITLDIAEPFTLDVCDNRERIPVDNAQHKDSITTMLRIIECNEAGLVGREADILRLRYPLNSQESKKTLEHIGDLFGITKERVRQLEAIALKKVRVVLDGEGVDDPEKSVIMTEQLQGVN